MRKKIPNVNIKTGDPLHHALNSKLVNSNSSIYIIELFANLSINIKALHSYIFVYMLAIAGNMAGPYGLTFF